MRANTASIAAMCAIAAFAAGCSTTPASHFYTLSRSETPAVAPAPKPANLSVVVGPVSIPAIVDMPQIVVSTGPNQVTIDEYNRWASPLQDNIARVVAENLVEMLGTPRVSLFQQSLNAEADYRVAIEVQSFESAPGEAATLNAVWIVRRLRDGRKETGRTTVREAAVGKGYEALAAAHSRALARMSREVADTIRSLERVGP
jgi:uncharacterized lipoprotein YmbA